MPLTLAELAVRHGCELRGDPDVQVSGVGTLQDAGPGQVAFLANPSYRNQLGSTSASVVVLDTEYADECPVAALISSNPYLTYAAIAADLNPPRAIRPGVHAGVVQGEGCEIADSAEVAAGAVLGDRVTIGEGAVIGPNCVLSDDVSIGAATRLVANCTLYERVTVGERCLVHAGAVLGADGFGMAREDDGSWTKVPQVGSVRVGNDVEIGAGTTVDRGAIEDTVLENGVRLDNQIQVGHNVVIGANTAIAAQVGISGSTTIGANCMIGGQTGIAGHIRICDNVGITGQSMVTNSITEPGVYSSGVPLDNSRNWRRNAVRFRQLDELARRVRVLEKKLG